MIRNRLSARTFDALIALALIVASQLEAWLGETARPSWLHAVVALAVAGSLAWRRRFPLAVMAVSVAGMFALDAEQLSLFAVTVIAAYTSGAELDHPRALAGLALAVVPFWVAFAALGDGAASDFVGVAVLYGGAWGAGRLVHESGREADQLADRAALLEREQHARAEEFVAAERARIARELHDVVSHSISVIAIQTQAVRRRLRPDQQTEAEDLRKLEVTARQAMAEMRRLFGVLRADGERVSLAPQPGLGQLDALVESTRATGLPVDLGVEGAPVALPPGIDLAAYRIVQEALTNTLKHARAGRAAVQVRFADHEVEVVIEDDGKGGEPSPSGGGHGLIGMRERALLYGGTFEAGPRADGFRVHATLPFGEAAAQ